MKKFLTNSKTMIALLVVAVLFLGFYVYMIARPVSYGLSYDNHTEYDSFIVAGVEFEGGSFDAKMTFFADDTMVDENSNLPEPIDAFYYYKDGYIFLTLSQTREGYEQEVKMIEEDFEGALDIEFYSAKANAFTVVMNSDAGEIVYTCTFAVVFAIVGGLFELALLGGLGYGLILKKKENK